MFHVYFFALWLATGGLSGDKSSTPQISDVKVTPSSPTSVVISWKTDTPSDTLVYFGKGDDGYGQVTDTGDTMSGVTAHSRTLTGLWPGKQYYFGVRSRGFSNGKPDPAKAAFKDSQYFNAPAPPADGPFEYVWDIFGPHHVMAGHRIFMGFSATTLQGKPSRLNITVSSLPPNSAIHWVDLEKGQCCGISKKHLTGDTAQLYDPGDTQFAIETSVGGKTPPGTYNLTITTSAGPNTNSASVQTKKWTLVVDPQRTLPQSTPTSYPSIPKLGDWKRNLIDYGKDWCNKPGPPGADQSPQYYDGTRVYYQLADFTKNAAWNACAANVKHVYRDSYVAPNKGRIPGYRRFARGLYMDFVRNGEAASKTAVIQLAPPDGLANGWSISSSRIRETSYLLEAYHYSSKLGADREAEARTAVDLLMGDIDQIAISGNAPWAQPFMCGLAADALIDYYEDGHRTDTRIPIAIKTLADWLWANAWGKDGEGKGFYYNSFDYSIGHPHSDMANLNLLVAPMYAWLYRYTGDPTYLKQGDKIFDDGLEYGSDGMTYGGGKNFMQQYRWSFDYVKWRSGQ